VTAKDTAKLRAPRPPDLDKQALLPAPVPLEDTDELDVYRMRVTGDHSGLSGAGEITETVFEGANLAESRFDPLTLADVAVRRGDLSNGVWGSVTARRVEITDCRAVGWRVFLDLAEDVVVEGCRWDLGSLHIGRTRGPVVFRGCTFAGTSLRGDLSRVVFDDCELARAEFAAERATDCDLRTSRLADARGLGTLRGARITVEQAVEIADLLAVELGFRIG
jgi:uncharacterized protein YjbI with pentapeptide repeats